MKYLLIACVAVAALAVPGAAMTAHSTATGATYTMYLGEFAQPPASLRKVPGTINEFLPAKVVIAVPSLGACCARKLAARMPPAPGITCTLTAGLPGIWRPIWRASSRA